MQGLNQIIRLVKLKCSIVFPVNLNMSMNFFKYLFCFFLVVVFHLIQKLFQQNFNDFAVGDNKLINYDQQQN